VENARGLKISSNYWENRETVYDETKVFSIFFLSVRNNNVHNKCL